MSITIKTETAATPITDFVDSFWALRNSGPSSKNVIVLPDGLVDLVFSRSADEPYHITLLGISTHAEQVVVKPHSTTFAISFKPPAIEYVLKSSVADILNNAKNVADRFPHTDEQVLDDFDIFCKNASEKISRLIPGKLDNRKISLFGLIYSSKGEISVSQLSEQVFWSSRQINRYFNHQLGIPIKTYCSLIRFRAAFEHIKKGKLFPEGNFTDQSHFIREIKRLSGVLPKDLYKNIDETFIQLLSNTK